MSNATEFPSGPIIGAAAPSTAAYYLRAALEWIDAIPADVANALPAMPGFDRDEAESVAQKPGCACQACRPLDLFNMRMILCETCGNKRCPHATDHRNECTGSNEPGQPGSSYQNVGAAEVVGRQTFQSRVLPWLMECFGAEISADRSERNHRFFEEATELVQSCGMTASEAHQLVDYVYGRPVGERFQEVGGTMVTLAALCLANELNMHAAGEAELARISEPATVLKIRAKQAAKPKHSPLPVAEPDDGYIYEISNAVGNVWWIVSKAVYHEREWALKRRRLSGEAAPSATVRTYTTRAGESVAGIALRQLGNHMEWRLILACNPTFADLSPDDYFPVGTVLNLPPHGGEAS